MSPRQVRKQMDIAFGPPGYAGFKRYVRERRTTIVSELAHVRPAAPARAEEVERVRRSV
jgi:hypothetical protein